MLFISPPFGNYLDFKNTISIKGSFTLYPRSGLIKQIFKTEQRPEKNITLDYEHSLSMVALEFLQESQNTHTRPWKASSPNQQH